MRNLNYLAVFISTILFLALTQTTIPPSSNQLMITGSRSSSFKQSCGGISRPQLFVEQTEKGRGLEQFLRGYFKIDGTKVIGNMIAGSNGQAKSQVLSNFGPIIAILLPFFVGALVTVVFFPIILRCCCNPYAFRKLKFWQSDQSPWTSKQLVIPAILSFILLAGSLAIAIIGFIKMSQLKTSYDQSICARAIVFDDYINGYKSQTGKYFSGIQTFKNKLPIYLDNFDGITEAFKPVKSTAEGMKKVNDDLAQAVSKLTIIPSGSGKPLNLAYPVPIQDEKPKGGLIKSNFSSQLGTIDLPKSLIGQAYNGIGDARNAIQKISNISDQYLAKSGPSTAQITAVKADIDDASNKIYDLDKKMQTNIKNYQAGPYWMTVGSYITFSFLLVVSILGAASIFFLAYRKSYGCRYFVYLTIFLIYFLTLLSFALAVTSGLAVPAALFICDYSRSSVSSANDFDKNLAMVIPEPKIRASISKCLLSERGTGLNELAGAGLIVSIQALPQALLTMQTLASGNQSANIKQSFSLIEQEVKLVMSTKKMDIDDPSTLAELNKLSLSWKYACTANGFHEDTWIPSLEANPLVVPCKQGIAPISDHTTCAMGADFETRNTGCVGCIDTSGIFKFTGTRNDVLNSLTLRYNSKDCATFNSELANTWNNFYRVKRDTLGPVIERYNGARSILNTAANTIDNELKPIFEQVTSNLTQLANSIVQPSTGLGAGLNCNLVGEDLEVLSDNICSKLLPRTHKMLIIFGVLSFVLLFATCFITCTGMRYASAIFNTPKEQVVVTEKEQAKNPKQSRGTVSSAQQIRKFEKELESDPSSSKEISQE